MHQMLGYVESPVGTPVETSRGALSFSNELTIHLESDGTGGTIEPGSSTTII